MSYDSTPSTLLETEIEQLELIGEGTFGKVYSARLIKTGEIVAVKKTLQDQKYKNR